jgi:pimeloyl-ACP methyl ester carboxylesterase
MTIRQLAQTESSHSLIRRNYANVNRIRLHYAESGSGDDLVILLHGFPEFWYSWRHQLDALGKRFHVVAPDMRGYNLSDKPAQVQDYRIELLVSDVIGLVDHFGAKQTAIVGHDWGAGVAWAVAQKYPERVSKLAVLQVPPAAAWWANLTLKQLQRSWYMFFFQLPRLPEWLIQRQNLHALERTFKETVIRKGSFTDEDIERYKEALRQPGALTAAINYYRANVFRLMSRRQRSAENKSDGKIQVPTLFIFGEQDFAILPETVQGIAKYVGAPYREVRIADSGHWVQNEAVDEVNSVLIDFLRSQ